MNVAKVLQALIDRGWTQEKLSKRLRSTQPTISRWLAGDREPGGQNMEAIRALAEEAGLLEVERGEKHVIAIMGYVGAGAEVEPEYEQVPPDGLEQVELPYPISEDMIGFRVRGASMMPKYDDGEILVVHRDQPWPIDNMVGDTAVVRTHDGRRFVKRIMPGPKPHTFNLESINAHTIIGARLAWASPVRMIIPNVGLKMLGRKVRAPTGRRARPGK